MLKKPYKIISLMFATLLFLSLTSYEGKSGYKSNDTSPTSSNNFQPIPNKLVKLSVSKEPTYLGTCDASAAIALSPSFFIVASDEDNILRVYESKKKDSKPVKEIDVSAYFKNNPDNDEADIEAVTKLDGKVFWITSHGANKKGKQKPSRYQFFASKITGSGKNIKVIQIGQSYNNLLEDIIKEEKLKKYNLGEAAKINPKEKGALNIEGLSITPKKHLLIGFRNPIPEGKALLLTLENPNALLEGKPARFGELIELDLEGLGVRSIEYFPKRKSYLIVAGHYDSGGTSKLFEWSGKSTEKAKEISKIDLTKINPEALILYPNSNTIQLLSDDGERLIEGTECKDLPKEKASFRGLFYKL